MATFRKGATVILHVEIYKAGTSELVDPATSMKVTVTDNNNGVEVDNQDMVPDSKGKYHYDFQTGSANARGKFRVIYTDTDGSRISREEDEFYVE